MTDFVSIANAKETHKGNFKGSCISQSDLKSGTSNNKDWTKKIFTLQDASGDIQITAWNEEIQFFKVGSFYEVENPWWKEYTDRNNAVQHSCNIGQYCKITAVNPPIDATKPKETSDTEIPPQPKGPGSINGEKLPVTEPDILGTTHTETIRLLQIEAEVITTMEKYQPRLSLEGSKIGMFVKEIYRQIKSKEND